MGANVNNKHRVLIGGALLGALVAMWSGAPADDARDTLRKCGAAYKKLTALRTESQVTIELIETQRSRRTSVQAALTAVKPDRFFFRYDIGQDEESEVRSDGAKLVTYRVGDKQFMSGTVPKDFGGKSLVRQPLRMPVGTALVLNLLHASDPEALLQADVTMAQFAKAEDVAGRRTLVVTLKHPWEKLEKGLEAKTLAALKGQTAELKLWIDAKDSLLRRVQADLAPAAKGLNPDRSPMRLIYTETFTKVDADPKTDPKDFVFAPPTGARQVREWAAGDRLLIGRPLKNLKLRDLSGKEVSLASVRGKSALLINLWAST